MTGIVPANTEKDLGRIVRGIRDLFEGRSNAYGSFTITESAATTVVTAPNCSPSSVILLTPTTANAAAELASGNMYVSAKAQGAFTVTHTNSATAGRTFDYRIGS